MRRIRSLMLAVLTLTPFQLIAAAERSTDPLDLVTERYARDRRRLIADNLHLTPSEAEQFWPLYEQFERDLLVLTQKSRAAITKFGENYESMTDAMAEEVMMDRLEIEEDRDRLRRVYLPKFKKVLPIKKLARYFQIESKIHAAVEAGIAQELPLIK